MKFHADLICVAGPFIFRIPEKCRNFLLQCHILKILYECRHGCSAIKGCISELGIEASPELVVIAVGGKADVADVMSSLVVLCNDICYVYLSEYVTSAGSGEVGLSLELYFRNTPLVYVHRIEVSMADYSEKVISRILSLVGQGERSLEHEIQTRIITYDSAVECIFRQCAGSCNTAVIIPVQVHPVHNERVYSDI